jgi:hypothetical protein
VTAIEKDEDDIALDQLLAEFKESRHRQAEKYEVPSQPIDANAESARRARKSKVLRRLKMPPPEVILASYQPLKLEKTNGGQVKGARRASRFESSVQLISPKLLNLSS